MKNLQARAVTESDLRLRKTILAAFWKVVLKMASLEEKKLVREERPR